MWQENRGPGIVGSLKHIIEYDGKRQILANPTILETSKEKMSTREGCLSFFDYRGEVERYSSIRVKAYNEDGQEFEIQGSGDLSSLLQHEIDHLNGRLYFDHLPNGQDDLWTVDGMPVIP